MTVVVAVRKNGRTVLAADSLVHFGGQRFGPENCRFHKIHRVHDSLMAWAGWSLYAEMLDGYLSRRDPSPLSTESEVFDFFIGFWRAMKDDYTFMYQRARAEGHPFVDLDSIFLLVNASGIFRVASDMDVTRFERYSAIGTGSQYALGALRVLYDLRDDPAAIAIEAAQVGIDLDVSCGGPIDIEEVPADPFPPPNGRLRAPVPAPPIRPAGPRR